jgi:peroxiredoxin
VDHRGGRCHCAGRGALAASLFTDDSSNAGRVVSGNVVEYAAGHRPLVPDITGTSLTGATIRLSSYRGKVLVLNFWGAWCSPCRLEAPTLKVASQLYQSRGLDFLGDDVGDSPPSALAFTSSVGISYPSINDPGYSVAQQFSQAAQVTDPPTTAVIDRTGHVVAMVLGPISNTELATFLHEAAA